MDSAADDTTDSGMASPRVEPPSGRPTNLALPLSTFVGRRAELAGLQSELAASRLLTITGSGGCGKTRLALELVLQELERRPDGVWCVELAPVGDPSRVPTTIAGVLGLREEFGRDVIDTLTDQLREFGGLLLLDNCEHVLAGVRPAVERLLQRCPGVAVVTTSREPLGLAGETTWRVPSLDEPEGVALFVERARSVRPDFAAGDGDVATITRIVDRLDGIPLAIELAAARVRMMSPAGIESALVDRFRLLTGGSRTSLERQRTLEASVAWSYDLLDPDEQRFGRRLAVMSEFDLEAAEAVGSGEDDPCEPLDLLTRLVDKSMVRVDHRGPLVRYRFLESVRQYLDGRLVESGEAEHVRARHLDHFLGLVERVEPEIAFRDSARLLATLELEHGNLEAALDFADASGRREEALRLATAMTLFWELRGHVGRATRWFRQLLDQPDDIVTRWRGRACWGAAHIGLYSGDIETMTVRAPEALQEAERLGDDWAMARALNTVGFATAVMNPSEARPVLEQSIEVGTRIGDEWAVLNSRKMLTAAGWAAQDEPPAMADLGSLREHASRLDATYFLAWYHGLRGYFATRRGDLATARTELDTAIVLCDRVGEPVTGGMSKAWLWAVDVLEGNHERARTRSAELLQRASASGSGLAIADLLANLGQVALAEGRASDAVELLAPAYAAQREHGIPFMVATIGTTLAAAERLTGADRAVTLGLLDDLDGLATALGNDWLGAVVDLERSRVVLARGDVEEAERTAHAALAVFARQGRAPDVVAGLEQLACIAASVESFAEAQRCFAAAAAGRAAMGLAPSIVDRGAIDQAMAAVAVALGAEVAEQHWAEGVALGLDDAVEYVSRARGERKRPSVGWGSLTSTEQRVVDLVTEGLTNPQIAARMFVARGTVKVHVSHIFAKLGVSSRAELAALATRRAGAGGNGA